MNAPDPTLLLRLCLLALLIAYWFQIRAMASDRALARKVELPDWNGRTIRVAPIMRQREDVRRNHAAHSIGFAVTSAQVEASRRIVGRRSYFRRLKAEVGESHPRPTRQ